MNEPKPKSTIRLLLESGPTDPLLMAKLTLLEELQEAHAKGDHKTMLEIGQKLAANGKEFDQAREKRRAMMEETVAQAKAIADPGERVKRLLAAFEFCVTTACAAKEESQDMETYNFGVRQLGTIGDALKAVDCFPSLAQLLDSADIEVRGFAAVWLRDVMPERISPILKEINKTESFGTPVGTQVYIAIRELEQAKERKGESEPDLKP